MLLWSVVCGVQKGSEPKKTPRSSKRDGSLCSFPKHLRGCCRQARESDMGDRWAVELEQERDSAFRALEIEEGDSRRLASLADEANARAVAAERRVAELEREWDGWEAKYQERLREGEELKAAVRATEAERDALKEALETIAGIEPIGSLLTQYKLAIQYTARAALAASVPKEEARDVG
jgi:hypothetical protein